MKRNKIKYRVGIALIIVEALVYISSLMEYVDGSGITYITSFANGDISGGVIDFVTFNFIGIIGIALVWASGYNTEKENYDRSSSAHSLKVDSTLRSKEKHKIKIVFFVFVLLFFITTTVIAAFLAKEYNKNVELQNKIYDLDYEISRLEKQYIMVKNTRDNVIKTRDVMKEELDFWKNHAVIVTEHGEKYHTFGCQYIEGSSFLIYNSEAAKSRGYEPCSVCDPPQ